MLNKEIRSNLSSLNTTNLEMDYFFVYRTPRLAWKWYKDYPIKEIMVSIINIIKQEIVIEESLKKKLLLNFYIGFINYVNNW